MPRIRRAQVQRTADTQYKFECQGCETEVIQAPPPELVMALEVDGKGKRMQLVGSTPLQCCIDCSQEIKEDNALIQKTLGIVNQSQVRQLREATELESVIPEEKRKAIEEEVRKAEEAKKRDERLDKLCDLMEKFMTIQLNQMVVPPRDATIVEVPNAESKAAKSAAPGKKAQTKRKPGRRS